METGHVGNLTVAQNRALLLLWKRFLQACETGPGRYQPPPESSRSGPSSSSRAGRSHASHDQGYFANANGTTARVSHSNANGHHGGYTHAHTNPATFGHAAADTHRYDRARAGAGAGTDDDRSGTRDDDDHDEHRNYYDPARDSPTYSFGPAADEALLKKYHSISTSGSHIAKDDRIKDQMRGAVEAKEMALFLQRHGGARLRTVFWEIVKGEHPDTVMLRYLRARKWNVDRALAVIGNIASFRVENDVFNLVKTGEIELVKTVGGNNVYKNGIAYAWGATDYGLPICYIEVARHFSSNQTQEELKRAIILFQEWLGMLMPPPVSRKIVCFNMTGFGLRNMDWWCVFFLVKSMEMYWPETLERVYVHRAPWFFKPIWTILRPLLDPVVRDKVRFTTTAAELNEYIPTEHLPRKTMAGAMDWHYKYPEPVADENDMILNNAETDQKLREVYYEHATAFERSTRALIRTYLQAPSRNIRTFKVNAYGSQTNLSVEEDEPEGADALRAQRDVDATRLRVSWLDWMPYTVAMSKYTRWKVWRPDGTILWTYPQMDGSIDYQIFGEGTSLPVLKDSLALIEEAQRLTNEALEEARAAAATPAPLSGGSRAARTARKRYRKAVPKMPAPQQDTEGADSSGPESPRLLVDKTGTRLPSALSPRPISDTEQLASPPLRHSMDATRQFAESSTSGRRRDFSGTDDELFHPSNATGGGDSLSEGGHLSPAAHLARLRSSSSAATFGVGGGAWRSRAERTYSHGFDGDAASARAALGAEKAGTGWTATPRRRTGGGHDRLESSEESAEGDDDLVRTEEEDDEEDGQAPVRHGETTVLESRVPGRILFAPLPGRGHNSHDDSAELTQDQVGALSSDSEAPAPGNINARRTGQPNLPSRQSSLQPDATPATTTPTPAAASPVAAADHTPGPDSPGAEENLARSSIGTNAGTSTAVDSPYVPPRKSIDPGTISFIPGLEGQDPIGQVVYDEDGVPH